jgi:hypothetical protein
MHQNAVLMHILNKCRISTFPIIFVLQVNHFSLGKNTTSAQCEVKYRVQTVMTAMKVCQKEPQWGIRWSIEAKLTTITKESLPQMFHM